MNDPLMFWLDEVLANRAASTRRVYRIYVTQFLDFLNMAAEAVVVQRQQDLMSANIREKKRYENLVKQFDQSLKTQGLTPGSRKLAWVALRSFFQTFDLDLNFSRTDAPKGESKEQKAITKPEIRRLLILADVRGVAIIYALKDTGFRSSDLVHLNVGDVDLESEYSMLKRRTKKQGIIVKTFLGPEAQRALKKYLTARRYGTNKIPAETITATSPLFRQDAVEVRRLTAGAVTTYMSRLTEAAQMRGVSAHAFRRFFEMALEATGVSPNWINQMIGNRLSGTQSSYSKPTDQQLRDAYISAYDRLRVDEPAFDTERLARQEEQFQQERAQRQRVVKNVLQLTDENLELKRRIQEVENTLDHLMPLIEVLTGPARAEIFDALHNRSKVSKEKT